MPRQKTDTPEECLSAMLAGLDNFFDPGDKLAASLPQNHEALPVYSLGLKEFPAKPANKLPKLKLVGWRFVGTGPASKLGCHVGMNPIRLIGVARANDLTYLVDCFRQVKELRGAPEELSGQNYELRALRIPGLLIEAFWVYCSDRKHADYVVPFGGIFGGTIPGEAPGNPVKWTLEPMRFYSAEKFFETVGKAAQRKLQMHAELYGPRKVGDGAQRDTATEASPPQDSPVSASTQDAGAKTGK